jgi:hypothetical protein
MKYSNSRSQDIEALNAMSYGVNPDSEMLIGFIDELNEQNQLIVDKNPNNFVAGRALKGGVLAYGFDLILLIQTSILSR